MEQRPQSARPRLACEIMPDRVIAARANDAGSAVELFATRTLGAGVIVSSLKDANVLDSGALASIVGDALSAVGGGRSRDVTLVLPDAAVRTVLLDFDEFPQRDEEALAVLRLRLRKSLPFDVDHARISYHVDRRSIPVRVIAAVALQSVVDEYESALRTAGFAPGVVVPSTLAALGAVEDDAATLVVKVDAAAVTVVIVEGGELRLLRNLENASGHAVSGQQLADEVYPSVVFYQDNFGSSVSRVLVGGLESLHEVTPALQQVTGTRPEALVPMRVVQSGLSGPEAAAHLAGVVGALL
jgi:type IV pilus assembly protein PilM